MAPRINGYLAASRRRALAVLADSPDGCTEAIMLAHGFTAELLIALVQDDLASVISERRGGSKQVELIRFKITEAGRQALR